MFRFPFLRLPSPFLLPASAAVPEMWAKYLFIVQVLDRLIRSAHDRQSSCALAVGMLCPSCGSESVSKPCKSYVMNAERLVVEVLAVAPKCRRLIEQ